MRNFAIPENLAPGPIADLVPIRVTQVSSLRPGLSERLTGAVQGNATRWREDVEARGNVQVHARFEDGCPALVSAGSHAYLAGWLEGKCLHDLMAWCLDQAGLEGMPLPEHIRLRRRGAFIFAFNYGNDAWNVPSSLGSVVIGNPRLEPGGVTILAAQQH